MMVNALWEVYYDEMNEDENEEETRYTYADYLAWETDARYELIDGAAYMMASPSEHHQWINGELFGQFWTFLRGKPCRVYAAPFDVRLFAKKNPLVTTVVQPDLLVVCDRRKLSKGGCNGPPDLVIEIRSPSNTDAPMEAKYDVYRDAGVREYWVVNPERKQVQVYLLQQGTYVESVYNGDTRIAVSILPGLSIDLKPLWEEL
ncbi:Uma2 family endonuclease [Breznakiellaceae bacterium SP9]